MKNEIQRRITRTPAAAMIRALCIFIAVCPLFCSVAHGQRISKSTSPPVSHFRYLIVLDGDLHDGRLVEILMDPQAFSKKNLVELFALLAKRFSDPDDLRIGVYTSLHQLQTPEEQDYAQSSGTDRLPMMDHMKDFPNAFYMRSEGNEAFKYSFGRNIPNRIVLIKGKIPFQENPK